MMKIQTYLEGLIKMKMSSERLISFFLFNCNQIKVCRLKGHIVFPVVCVFQDSGLPSFADELAARIKGETPSKQEADRTCKVKER